MSDAAGIHVGQGSGRDAGLSRQIGPWALGAAILNGVVGAGIFTLPAAMAQAAGALAPWAYLVCAVAMGFVVLCFAEAGSRLPTSGGVYGTVAHAFGPMAGFVCGILTWMASVLACGGIAGALADTIGTVVPSMAGGWGRVAIVVIALSNIMSVNLRGVREAAWLVSVATLAKLVPLGLFVVVGAWALLSGSVPPAPALQVAPISGLAQAVILGVFAFSGMETPLAASGEVADGHRTVPCALFGAMALVLVLYVGIQLVAQHLLGAGLAGQAAPLAAAAGSVASVGRFVLVIGAAISMLGWLGSDILGAPRILFAFARDGLLPRALGWVHPRTHTPNTAIVVHTCIATFLALSGSFTGLVVASTLNTAGRQSSPARHAAGRPAGELCRPAGGGVLRHGGDDRTGVRGTLGRDLRAGGGGGGELGVVLGGQKERPSFLRKRSKKLLIAGAGARWVSVNQRH